jgi:hypothetical protein
LNPFIFFRRGSTSSTIHEGTIAFQYSGQFSRYAIRQKKPSVDPANTSEVPANIFGVPKNLPGGRKIILRGRKKTFGGRKTIFGEPVRLFSFFLKKSGLMPCPSAGL